MKKADKTESSTYEASKKIRNEWDMNPVTRVHDKGANDPYKQRRKDKNDRKSGRGDYER
ncbi:MAG: hypothetical protein ACM3UU_10325 [Ignavibacteriales bacterium]